MIWHTQPIDAVLAECKTNREKGLTAEEAQARLLAGQENIWELRRARSFGKRFLAQASSPAVILLVAAAVLCTAVLLIQTKGHIGLRWLEPLTLVLMTALTAFLGAMQEGYAERSLDAMQRLTGHQAQVLRDGQWQTISPSKLVRGDIVRIGERDLCPADCRLLDAMMLTVDESVLTGEDTFSTKTAGATVDSIDPVAKRANMLFAGTAVTGGTATAVVVETGIGTEYGKQQALLNPKRRTLLPLQKHLHTLGRRFSLVTGVACAVFLLIGLIRGLPILDLVLTVTAMAVAIIPEGLSAVATIVVAIGVSRMVKQQIVVRRIKSVDTLSRVSVICTDKSGVLTQNKPTLTGLFVAGKYRNVTETNRPESLALVRMAALCSDGTDAAGGGDPYEQVIIDTAEKLGMPQSLLTTEYPRIGELPFDRQRKRMTTVHLFGEQAVVIVKGAPEKVLDLCVDVPLDKVAEAYWEMGNRGQRILAVAFKEVPPSTDISIDELESGLRFAGLIGLEDPVCPDSLAALRECRTAGITPIVVTGDHISTASAVAMRLGILSDSAEAIDGNRLAAMSDEELAANIRQYRLYARISPQDKCRVVKAWQQAGETVAITGKDVTDLPALRQADIGFAFGKSGDDAARGNADLILQDTRLSTLIQAVKSARRICRTIERISRYFLACNTGELILMMLGILLFGVMPLSPILLLWLNLVTDSLPALAIGLEKHDRFTMTEKPRMPSAPLLLNRDGVVAFGQAILIGMLALVAYRSGRVEWLGSSSALSVTMAFAVLSLSELLLCFTARSSCPLYRVGIFRNGALWLAIGVSAVLIAAVLLIPPIGSLFGTVAIPGAKWTLCLILALIPAVFTEIAKLVSIKR